MPDTTVSAVDKSLAVLLQAEKDFPGYSLDFCSGYVSTDGVLLLKRMLKTAPKARAIVGLNATNHVSAFQMLRDDCNVEHNLFITGQRHTEPFISIEAQIAAFCSQAYLFDANIEKELAKIERELRNNVSDIEYKKRLLILGIKPKAQLEFSIPEEAQQVALETLVEFTENTKLEYAYQMLLLLVMLKCADENGEFSLKEAAHCFSEFYRLRREAGLPTEKSYGLKHAVVDNLNASQAQISQMLKTSPFPRFERQGLLDLSEDDHYFVVNPALLEALTPAVRESLRRKAIGRLVEHFGEEEEVIGAMVERGIG